MAGWEAHTSTNGGGGTDVMIGGNQDDMLLGKGGDDLFNAT